MDIETTNIVPVDLNAYICGNYEILSHLFLQLGRGHSIYPNNISEHESPQGTKQRHLTTTHGTTFSARLSRKCFSCNMTGRRPAGTTTICGPKTTTKTSTPQSPFPCSPDAIIRSTCSSRNGFSAPWSEPVCSKSRAAYRQGGIWWMGTMYKGN
jgi:hypothetical protein